MSGALNNARDTRGERGAAVGEKGERGEEGEVLEQRLGRSGESRRGVYEKMGRRGSGWKEGGIEKKGAEEGKV